MERVLVIENNEDIQEILSRKISMLYDASVIRCSFAEAASFLTAGDFALVISDVEPSFSNGFWIHDHLRQFHPLVPLALFVDEYAVLRNIPQLDSVVKVAVLKPDFQKLYFEIEKLGVLNARYSH